LPWRRQARTIGAGWRHFFRRQLDAQVAARHHDGVGLFDDLVQALDSRRLFELGHDPRTSLGERTRLVQVRGALHERERQPFDTKLQRELEVAPVLSVSADSGSTASGTFTPLRSDSEPPTITSVSANPAVDRFTLRRSFIVEKQVEPGFSTAKISGCGRYARGVPGLSVRSRRYDEPAASMTDRRQTPTLRPLQVGKHADRRPTSRSTL
jgi:hypothetical protein